MSYGIFEDLVPGNTPAGSNPSSRKTIYDDLLPKAEAPIPKKPGILSRAVKGVSNLITKATEPLAPESLVGGGTVSNTLKSLPSEITRHLPFGVGAAISGIQDNPEIAANISAGDMARELPGAILHTAKEFAKAPVRAVADIYGIGKQFLGENPGVKFNLPVLGEVTNAQYNVAERVKNGENPLVAVLEEGAGSIFDTLFFADIVNRVAGPRTAKVAESKGSTGDAFSRGLPKPSGVIPKGEGPQPTMDIGPKTGRLYEAPTAYSKTAQVIPNKVLGEMQSQGVSFGKNFDPSQPVFFRVKLGEGGSYTAEMLQLKPSYLKTAYDKFFRGRPKAPTEAGLPALLPPSSEAPANPLPADLAPLATTAKPAEVEVIFTKTVKEGEITKAITNAVEGKPLEEKAPESPVDFSDLIPKEVAPTETEEGISPEEEAKAKTDWEDNYSEKYGKMSEEISSLEKQIKEGGAKAKKELGPKVEALTKEQGRMEEEFIQKYKNVDKAVDKVDDVKPKLKLSPNFIEEAKALKKETEKTLPKEKIEAAKELAKRIKTEEQVKKNKPAILENEEAIREEYLEAVPREKLDEGLAQISGELELSQAGFRYLTDAGEARGVKSTFPKWLPEEYRSKKLFDKVLGRFDPDSPDFMKFPEGNRPKQRALFNEILSRLDEYVGSNTSGFRNNILKFYEGKTDEEIIQESEKSITGGDEGGINVDEVIRDFEKPSKGEEIKGGSGAASVRSETGGTPDFPVLKGTTPDQMIHPIEIPELVDLARSLMGHVPQIVKKTGKALGRFVHGGENMKIKIIAKLFAGENLRDVSATLAHEIGHLVDYLPDNTLDRGNLLGRLKTLKGFMSGYFGSEGALDTKAFRTQALNEVLREKGYSRGDFMSSPSVRAEIKQDLQKRYAKLIEESGAISNKKVKEELLAVTRYWSPYDPKLVTDSYRRYRESSKELYAEALSMLFNSPGLLEKMAPTFYHEFFKGIDEKPAVRDAYFELQSLLSGERSTLIAARRAGVQKMFKDGDYKAIELQNKKIAEAREKRRSFISAFKFNVIDKNYPIIERINALEKKGVHINPDDNPVYYLEERNYLGGKVKALLEKYIEPIYHNLENAGVPWLTFGEALFYQRIIAGDRSTQANPRGITPDAARELQADLSDKLTPEQGKVLAESILKFREFIKRVAEEAYKEGLYTPELHKKMEDNPAYVTFQVLDHIEEGMSSKIYQSIGTFKDIANVADSSILKVIATVRAIERNKVAKKTIDFLRKFDPKSVEEAKTVFSGKGMRILDSKNRREEKTIIVMRGGKAEGYYVDPYIAASINNESVGQNQAINTLLLPITLSNRLLFRPLFIGLNLAFQSFNAVRDFTRFWKNIPYMTLVRVFQRYKQGARLSKIRAFGMPEKPSEADKKALEDLQNLEESQVFSVTFTKLMAGAPADETQIEHILEKSDIPAFKKEPEKNPALRFIMKVLNAVENLGEMIETMPKAAGFYELSNGKPLTREQRSYIRRFLGSPDFLAGGYLKQATNEIFLFSNAIAQGIRSDIEVAIEPETRSGYWWKTAKWNLLPKVLMWAASLGLMGTWVKKMMDDASEYDKTNYSVLPLGEENGKTIYLRIPQDEAGRLVGGVFWKLLNIMNPDNEKNFGKDLSDVAAFMGGQVPGISPAISTADDIFAYISGKNPYDSFRGRNVLTDQEFAAGGSRAFKGMAKYVFNQVGGGIFYRFDTSSKPSEMGAVEKSINLPVLGNITNRFIRVSNYGETERLQQIKRNVASEEANRQLDEKDAVSQAIRQALEKTDLSAPAKKEIQINMLRSIFGKDQVSDGGVMKNPEDIERANRITKKFRLGILRGASDQAIGALIDSTSNAQKISVLLDLKGRMSESEYREFVTGAVKEGVISVFVTNEVTRLSKPKK